MSEFVKNSDIIHSLGEISKYYSTPLPKSTFGEGLRDLFFYAEWKVDSKSDIPAHIVDTIGRIFL